MNAREFRPRPGRPPVTALQAGVLRVAAEAEQAQGFAATRLRQGRGGGSGMRVQR